MREDIVDKERQQRLSKGENQQEDLSDRPSRKQSQESSDVSEDFKTIPYSIDAQAPLGSNFDSPNQNQTMSMQVQESESLKTRHDSQDIKANISDEEESEHPTSRSNFYKQNHKVSEDYTYDKKQQDISNEEKQTQNKSELPKHQDKGFKEESLQGKKSSLKSHEKAEQKTSTTKASSYEDLQKQKQKKSKNSKDIPQPIIEASFSSSSPQKTSQNTSPRKKQKKLPADRLEFRKIPNDLYTSYDELNLSVDKANLPSRFKDKKKEKEKPQQKVEKEQAINEEVFASLPILEGYCCLRPAPNSESTETKFIIIKNTLVFQTFRRLDIVKLKKIKFLLKEEEIFIKMNFQNEESPEKDHVILLSVLSKSESSYFAESYRFFAQVIVRKLLLMNLFINEVTEKHEAESQKSYEYEAELFKKAQFLSNWERRKLHLKNNFLRSFKGSKCTYEVSGVTELWSRFEMINGYFVIKMWHKYEKLQLGIPLMDYTESRGKNNWLFGLAKLVAND